MTKQLFNLVRPFLRFADEQMSRLLWLVFFFLAQSKDITPPNGGACLVIAPHPDDETLGCGGTILKLRQAGTPVHVVVVTDGRLSSRSEIITPDELAERRKDEVQNACRLLNVDLDNITFFDFRDGETTGKTQEIAEALREHIMRIVPSLILSPYLEDLHPDHRIVAEAMVLLQREGAVTCPVYTYPLWFWPTAAVTHLMQPWKLRNLYRVEVKAFVNQKQRAMLAHQSQSKNLTGENSWRILRSEFLRRFFKPYELYFKQDVS